MWFKWLKFLKMVSYFRNLSVSCKKELDDVKFCSILFELFLPLKVELNNIFWLFSFGLSVWLPLLFLLGLNIVILKSSIFAQVSIFERWLNLIILTVRMIWSNFHFEFYLSTFMSFIIFFRMKPSFRILGLFFR